MSTVAAGVLVMGIVVLYAAFIFFAFKGAQRRTPDAISERMRTASEPVYVKVSPFEHAWNPITGRREVIEKLRGPGWANYRLDDEGLVHFEFRHKTGRVVSQVGSPAPLPEPAAPPSAKSAKSKHVAWGAAGGYVLFALAGFLVGLSVAPPSSRGDAAAMGALLGWLTAYVVLMLATLAYRSRARARKSG